MLGFIAAAEKIIPKALEIIRYKKQIKAWLCAAVGLPLTFQGFALLGNCCCVRPGLQKPINDLKLMINSEVEV